MDLDHQAFRLKALWKSGRAKYASFFAVLGEVRQEIGDKALPSWCFHKIDIGLDVITKTTQLLRQVDAKIARDALKEVIDGDARVNELLARNRKLEARIRELEAKERGGLSKADDKLIKAAIATANSQAAENQDVNQLLAKIHGLEAQVRELKAKDESARVNQLLARIRELEAQVAAKVPPHEKTRPLRDRADYLREYMRKRRAEGK
jgi:hypothetical protein